MWRKKRNKLKTKMDGPTISMSQLQLHRLLSKKKAKLKKQKLLKRVAMTLATLVISTKSRAKLPMRAVRMTGQVLETKIKLLYIAKLQIRKLRLKNLKRPIKLKKIPGLML